MGFIMYFYNRQGGTITRTFRNYRRLFSDSFFDNLSLVSLKVQSVIDGTPGFTSFGLSEDRLGDGF